jgi:exodeoxyribonuclease X
MTAIILDTETADFKGPLIELAWLNIQTGETFQQRYNPARKIHPRATDVHHIRDEDVANQPHHLTVSIPRDVEYIVGHNISFDMRMLKCSGVDVSRFKTVCTLELARRAFPEFASYKLGALIDELFDPDFAREVSKNAHSALVDVRMTALLLDKIIERMGWVNDIEQIHSMTETACIPMRITFGKHKGSLLSDLPADYVAWLLRQSNIDPSLRKGLKG